jgi:signal transduction histidine kinase
LAVIRGAVELIEAQTTPGTAKALARIQRAVSEMSEFTDALLTLSREDSPIGSQASECDVASVLVKTVEDQHNVQPTKRIGLEIPEEEALRVAAPESMVAMVIGNLVRNALQHGTGDEVICRLQGRALTVANAGVLPNEKLSESPQRRFTTHPRGHGMGLYLVRRICERYRWAFRLENTQNGVLVTVNF